MPDSGGGLLGISLLVCGLIAFALLSKVTEPNALVGLNSKGPTLPTPAATATHGLKSAADGAPGNVCAGSSGNSGEGCWNWKAAVGSNKQYRAKYGFYLHVYDKPAAVIFQVNKLRQYFPDSPIYIMSDGGDRFDGLCKKKNCTFKLCPPANDRWHPWPFLHRMRTAALEMNSEYLIYLEPDNTVHSGINYEPNSDAGGMQDNNPRFSETIVNFVEQKIQRTRPGWKWGYTGSGLAGGSYFKTSVVLDAFSDESVASIDWEFLYHHDNHRVFSSDFAMPLILSLSGYQYRPWKDIIQWDLPNQPNVSRYAFEHYGRGVEGGKPEYNRKVESWRDQTLYASRIEYFRMNQVNCQRCWNISQYVEKWGSTDCANPLPTKNYLDL